MPHELSPADYPGYDVLISDDAERFIVRDTQGRENSNGKWTQAATAVDYRFVGIFHGVFLFESAIVHHHDTPDDCAKYELGPGDDELLVDDLPGDVASIVRYELGVALASAVGAIDLQDPSNSRTVTNSDDPDGEDLDPEKTVDIDIDGGEDA